VLYYTNVVSNQGVVKSNNLEYYINTGLNDDIQLKPEMIFKNTAPIYWSSR